MSERDGAIRLELEQIRVAHGGLQPERVVEFAENPSTALHKEFEWDDSLAAHRFRLEQARHIIRVRIISIGAGGTRARGYVSLRQDRGPDGAGYRSTLEVLADGALRAALLEEAMREARSWRKRYERLRELAGVFAALDQVEESIAS